MTNEQAIELLMSVKWNANIDEQEDKALSMAIEALSAQSKTGEWIEDGYNHFKAVCDQCGEPCATYVMNHPRDRFCKWCGADMRGEQDDNTGSD